MEADLASLESPVGREKALMVRLEDALACNFLEEPCGGVSHPLGTVVLLIRRVS